MAMATEAQATALAAAPSAKTYFVDPEDPLMQVPTAKVTGPILVPEQSLVYQTE
jgi:hypothetical protein